MTHSARIAVCMAIAILGSQIVSFAQQVTLSQGDHAALKSSGALDGRSDFSVTANTAQPGPGANRLLPTGTAKGGGGGLGCSLYIVPDATYTPAMLPNDDLSSAQIFLPFTFNFYGTAHTSLYINNNGNVSFGGPYGTFSASGFPNAGFVMIAPFWADVDTRPANGGTVWYLITPTAIYINWEEVGYYSMLTDKLNTFQLIITDGTDPYIGVGNNVAFSYLDMDWTTGQASCFGGVGSPCSNGLGTFACDNSVGAGYGFCGTSAVVGANLGNGVDYIQIGTFDRPGTAYDGPFGLVDEVDWLDYKDFVFSTAISTQNISPIPSGSILCDTVQVCVGSPSVLTLDFLAPEPSQIVSATSSCPTIPSYIELVNTSGISAQIISQVTPTPADIGVHTISYTATDNGVPAATVTVFVTLEVLPVGIIIAPTALSTCSAAPPINLFTLFAGSPPPGGIWEDPNGNPWTGILDPAVDISGTYTYILGNGSPCPTVGIVTVTISTTPDPGTPGAGTYCADNAIVDLFTLLGGTPQGGGTWADPNSVPHTGMMDPAIDPSGIYTYTITGILPCPTASSTVTITINQPVDAGTDATLALCRADAPFDLITALGGTPDAGGTWVDPNLAAFTNPLDPAVALAGIYTYTMVGAAPCPTKTATVTITFDPMPIAGTDAAFDICADGSPTVLFALLGGTPDPGGAWLSPAMAPHTGTLMPATDQNGMYQYVAYGIGACNALTDTALVDVYVNLLPVVQFGSVPVAGCVPLDVEFTNTTDPVYTAIAEWDMGDGGNGSNLTTQPYTYTAPGIYTVSLTVTSDSGCVGNLTYTDMIVVEPAPIADFTTYPNPATVSNSAVLLTALDPYAVVFEWTITEQGTNEVLGTSEDRELLFEFPNDLGGLYDVCLVVQDLYGCADTACKVVEIRNPLLVFVPNTFTPDGDGINDLFFPSIIGSDPGQYELLVFDRWGGNVFASTDQQQAWDGKHRNGGEVLAQGMYTWKLRTAPENEGGRKEYRGHVTLIK